MNARPTIDQRMLRRLLDDDEPPCEYVNGVWHSRIHVSPEILKRLNRKAYCGKNHDGSYKLLDDASLNDDPGMCEACMQAKSRVKYGRPADTEYKVPGELWA